ncbi:MAG TPA: S8 family serine peptidase [Blastocatellia bacterium]|nr:S8 family serine peptidase [Blastocatellia bacterium]
MNKKFSLLARLMALLLVFGASTNVFQTAKAHIKRRDDAAPARQALNTSGLVRAIVELESAPVIERVKPVMSAALRDRRPNLQSAEARGYEAQVESEQANFKSRAALVSPGLRVRTEIRGLANAVSIEAPGAEVAAISALPGVKRVELVKEYQAALDASVPLINAPAMWTRLGGSAVAGDGMKIAILDTGIDIANPLFSDAGYVAPAGFPKAEGNNLTLINNKIIAAKSFIPGTTSAQDENGHGTNVAGIAAGNFNTLSPLGLVSGVAPHAFLGNYRVLARNGSGPTDGIAAAVDAAVRDGFDVINLSLGGEAGNGLDLLSRTVEKAVAGGSIVTIAAGNEGNGGLDDEATISSPGIAPSAITVAASSNSHLAGSRLTAVLVVPGAEGSALADVKSARGIGAVNASALDTPVGPLPYVDVSTLDNGARGCNGFPANSLSGKIALIERGGKPPAAPCTFISKVNAAAAAKASAVIIYNKDVSEGADGGEDLFPMSVDGTNILSVFVKRSAGLALKDWLQSHPGAQVSITPQPVGSVDVPSDALAAFSSRGPSSLGGLKPDIAAPGTNIYSGAINADNSQGVTDPSGFTAVQGTSQAAPHVAGAAALVKQLHPSWTPAEVKSALMNSAMTDVFTTVAKTEKAGVLATGAGRVDLDKASTINATFAPASLSFGVTKLKKKAVSLSSELKITNVSGESATFTLSIEQLDPGDGVVVAIASAPSVQLAQGQTSTAMITIDAKKSAEKRHYTGYVVVTSSTGQTLRVPYWVRFKKKV